MKLKVSAIKLISKFCANEKDSREIFKGVKFDFDKQTLDATNGHVLFHGSWEGEKSEFREGEDSWAIIPCTTLVALTKGKKANDMVEITIDTVDGVGYKPIMGNYVDADRVVKSARKNKDVKEGVWGLYQSQYVKLIEEAQKLSQVKIYKPEVASSPLYLTCELMDLKSELLIMPTMIKAAN